MATVKEVVTDALEEILAQSSEEPISAADGETGIRYLNDMLTMWELLGVDLGYTVVENMGDYLTVDDGAIFGIKKLLAISLAPKFNAEVSPFLMRDAKLGWEAIEDLTFKINAVNYPSTLPIGSGNSLAGTNTRFSRYYPEVEKAILT